MKNYLIVTLILILAGISANAQTQTIKGNVTAFKEFPVNAVSIKAKKSKANVLSDSLGNFTIECKDKDMIYFVAGGFEPYRVKIKESNFIEANLIYKGDQDDYDDAVKSNHLSKETLDYCIANLFEDNNNYDRMANVMQIIKSIYPAARIFQEDQTEKIVLSSRGPNSINANTDMATSNQALLLVDGIAVEEISSIDPTTVRSVKIHVGTSAARWGLRGGNGVVEIFLKR